jgi:hypothetical protein
VSEPKRGAAALFSPKVVFWLLGIGIFSFLALVVLSAYAPDLRTGSDGGGHALSRSAVGFAGLNTLLKAERTPVIISRDTTTLKRSRGLLILTPAPQTQAKALKAFAFKGATLVVLPKWTVSPDPLRSGWVRKVGVLDGGDKAQSLFVLSDLARDVRLAQRKGSARPILTSRAQNFEVGEQLVPGRIDSLQTVDGEGLTPILVDETGAAVLARVGTSKVYVLSDPDLLNTHGLRDPDTARAGLAIVDVLRDGGPVFLDVTLHGIKRSRSLLKVALEPPFLAATLCLLAAALLMGVHALIRFGPMRRGGRAFALGKEALTENTAGLIRMARREPRMGRGYAALARATVATALATSRDLSDEELGAMLDRLGEARNAGRFTELAAEADRVRDRAGLLQVARKLYNWKLEMTRGRR